LEQVKADAPVALWDVEEEGAPAGATGRVESADGLTNRDSHTLPAKNRGILLHGDGGRIEIADRPEVRFDAGDTITIEAWAKIDGKAGNGARYIIGKGRETSGGSNQNWALRLAHSGRSSKLSFLFHSRPEGDHEGDYHRWTSTSEVGAD